MKNESFSDIKALDIKAELERLSFPIQRKTLYTEDGETSPYVQLNVKLPTSESFTPLGEVKANSMNMSYKKALEKLLDAFDNLTDDQNQKIEYKLTTSILYEKSADVYQEYVFNSYFCDTSPTTREYILQSSQQCSSVGASKITVIEPRFVSVIVRLSYIDAPLLEAYNGIYFPKKNSSLVFAPKSPACFGVFANTRNWDEYCQNGMRSEIQKLFNFNLYARLWHLKLSEISLKTTLDEMWEATIVVFSLKRKIMRQLAKAGYIIPKDVKGFIAAKSLREIEENIDEVNVDATAMDLYKCCADFARDVNSPKRRIYLLRVFAVFFRQIDINISGIV